MNEHQKKFLNLLMEKDIFKLSNTTLETLDILLFDNYKLEIIVKDNNDQQYVVTHNKNSLLLQNRFKSTFPIKFYSFEELKDKFDELILIGY